MTSLKTLAALTLAVALVTVAGCGGGSDYSATTDAGGYGGKGSAAEKPASTGSEGAQGVATVATASVPKLGTVIVDADGFTLYDFHKDKGAASSCYGACAGTWPPLLTSASPKADGVPAGKLGTSKRHDGTIQVTFAGHPLYTYIADRKPGEANGNDIDQFGGEWYALEPSGSEPED